MKAFLLEHRMPQRDALAAAMVERFAYSRGSGTDRRRHRDRRRAISFRGWLIVGLTMTAAVLFG